MRRHKKKSVVPVFDDEMERDLIRLMPSIPRVFEKLVTKLEDFDGSQPKAFLEQIERDFKPVGESIKGREYRFQRLFDKFFGKSTARVLLRKFADNFTKTAKMAASSDSRYSLLLKLMHDVDRRLPFASLMIASEYVDARAPGYVDRKAFFVAQSTAMNLFRRAEQASAEERATLALIAHAKTVDLLYKPYLIALWFFSYVKAGRRLPPHVPELGTMLAVITERLPEYRGLIEQDAVWMRNSAVHNEPDYETDDSIWMWDRKHPRRKVKVSELMTLTESIYVISTHTIQSTSQLYFLRDVVLNTGLLDMAADCMGYAASGEQDKLKAAETEAKRQAESILSPLIEFVNDIQSNRRKSQR